MKKTSRRVLFSTASVVMTALAAVPAAAGPLVYVPINPAFGGPAANGPQLLAEAQAQNTYADRRAGLSSGSGSGGSSAQTALQQFNESLQRAVLSRLTFAISGQIFNDDGDLTPGTITTSDFIINVAEIGNGQVQIITTDRNTGETTEFTIQQTF